MTHKIGEAEVMQPSLEMTVVVEEDVVREENEISVAPSTR